MQARDKIKVASSFVRRFPSSWIALRIGDKLLAVWAHDLTKERGALRFHWLSQQEWQARADYRFRTAATGPIYRKAITNFNRRLRAAHKDWFKLP